MAARALSAAGPCRSAHQAASLPLRRAERLHPLVDPFAVKNLEVCVSMWDPLCESWAQSPLLQSPELGQLTRRPIHT